MDDSELFTYAKELQVNYQLLKKTAELGRLPVVNFAAGGLGKCYCVNCVVFDNENCKVCNLHAKKP